MYISQETSRIGAHTSLCPINILERAAWLQPLWCTTVLQQYSNTMYCVRSRHHIAYFATMHATRNWQLEMRMRYCAELGLDPKLLFLYL